MSWRLEQRDLSGEWVLIVDELDLIMKRLKKLTALKLYPQTIVELGDKLLVQGTMWRRSFDDYDQNFNLWQQACQIDIFSLHQSQ